MIYTELPWYDDRVTHLTNDFTQSRPLPTLNMCYTTPREIYEYWDERVWKQEEAKKAALSVLVFRILKITEV